MHLSLTIGWQQFFTDFPRINWPYFGQLNGKGKPGQEFLSCVIQPWIHASGPYCAWLATRPSCPWCVV